MRKRYVMLLGLAAVACRPCTPLPLSPADRAWAAAYPTLGQRVAFRGSRGTELAFRVAERVDTYNNQDCNWLEVGTTQPAHFHVTLRPTAEPLHELSRQDLTLYVLKWHAERPATLDFRLAGLEAYFNQPDDAHHFTLQPRACTLADGRTFPRAYYFAAGQNAIAYNAGAWRSFYWDQQAGLLRLEAPDGEVFDLLAE